MQRPVDHPTPDAESHPRERRRSVRVDVLSQVEAHAVPHAQPLSLLELSLTGLSVDATSPFEIGVVTKFRLSLDSERRSVFVQARVRHCTLQSAKPGGLAIYRVGFEFVAPTDSTLREIVAMVESSAALWQSDAGSDTSKA
jgi:PilZ domain